METEIRFLLSTRFVVVEIRFLLSTRFVVVVVVVVDEDYDDDDDDDDDDDIGAVEKNVIFFLYAFNLLGLICNADNLESPGWTKTNCARLSKTCTAGQGED